MARDHVWYRDRFGNVDRAQEEGRYYSNNPEYFNKWVELGYPGVNYLWFERYFKLKPI